MRKVAILVDGAFYLKHRKRYYRDVPNETGQVEAIAQEIHAHCLRHVFNRKDNNNAYEQELEKLYRIFFYDCPPMTKKVDNPISKRPIDFSKSKVAQFRVALHEQLKKKRNVALRLGILDEKNAQWTFKKSEKAYKFFSDPQAHPLSAEDLKYHAQQKGVDMKMGLDVASMAYKKQVDKIVLISGDSDFVPTAKLARREGVEFILDAMGETIKADLQEHIDGLNTKVIRSRDSF